MRDHQCWHCHAALEQLAGTADLLVVMRLPAAHARCQNVRPALRIRPALWQKRFAAAALAAAVAAAAVAEVAAAVAAAVAVRDSPEAAEFAAVGAVWPSVAAPATDAEQGRHEWLHLPLQSRKCGG